MVADRVQAHNAIMAMGLQPTVRILKVRRTAAVGDVVLCVDEVDSAGVFIEAERLVANGAAGAEVQAGLSRFIESLEIRVEWCEQTHDTLVRAALSSREDPGRSELH